MGKEESGALPWLGNVFRESATPSPVFQANTAVLQGVRCQALGSGCTELVLGARGLFAFQECLWESFSPSEICSNR